MKNNYTVYMHIFPTNKVYIGITKRKPKYRWNNGNAYYHNLYMRRAIEKYGWENVKHEILYEGLTKEEAEQKEIELIAKYNSANDMYGYNIEKGGSVNKKISVESKNKMSKSRIGHIVKEETKEKIRQKLKGTRHGYSLISMKKINMYDLNNNFIKSFDCMKDCQRELNIPIQHISLCCKNKLKKTHGYIFKYK